MSPCTQGRIQVAVEQNFTPVPSAPESVLSRCTGTTLSPQSSGSLPDHVHSLGAAAPNPESSCETTRLP